MCSLWPMSTIGVPGMPTPAAWYPGESWVSWNQIAGRVRCRWGSPASNAPPEALFAPATAQLLLAPPFEMRPAGSAASFSYTAWADIDCAADSAAIVAMAWGGAALPEGPGSYGAW